MAVTHFFSSHYFALPLSLCLSLTYTHALPIDILIRTVPHTELWQSLKTFAHRMLYFVQRICTKSIFKLFIGHVFFFNHAECKYHTVKKHPFYFSDWGRFFRTFALRTNTSSNHDGRAGALSSQMKWHICKRASNCTSDILKYIWNHLYFNSSLRKWDLLCTKPFRLCFCRKSVSWVMGRVLIQHFTSKNFAFLCCFSVCKGLRAAQE